MLTDITCHTEGITILNVYTLRQSVIILLQSKFTFEHVNKILKYVRL